MKGVVFTEFFTFIEEVAGYEMVDHLIENTNPKSGGVYTSVGTYSHQELVMYLLEYCKVSHQEPPAVLRLFGKHMFRIFQSKYSHFFSPDLVLFDFLKSLDSYIHVEVLKLYPDAQLPSFETVAESESMLKLVYRSERHLGDFAYGLFEATIAHFGEKATLEMNEISSDGSAVEFVITKTH